LFDVVRQLLLQWLDPERWEEHSKQEHTERVQDDIPCHLRFPSNHTRAYKLCAAPFRNDRGAHSFVAEKGLSLALYTWVTMRFPTKSILWETYREMDIKDIVQVILVMLIAFFVANYLFTKWRLRHQRISTLDDSEIEGFANPSASTGGTDIVVLGNDHLFDELYARIYDKIVDGAARQDAEANLAMAWVKTYRPEKETWQILDIGCGTGGQVNIMREYGVGKAVGIDKSDAMIERGRKLHPKADLRVGDAEIIGSFAAGEFNVATMFYFTYYYLKDRTTTLKNIFMWLQPGSCFIVHIVNREKFDPILESASPFVAFSVQKYAKERVTRSKVTFDKFDYEADFHLDGSIGEFREEFRFKDGKKRRQVHTLRMHTMDQIVADVEAAGFKYRQYIDLTGIGYEYQYLFCFVR
jgi:SAM-dependent methyltransferase